MEISYFSTCRAINENHAGRDSLRTENSSAGLACAFDNPTVVVRQEQEPADSEIPCRKTQGHICRSDSAKIIPAIFHLRKIDFTIVSRVARQFVEYIGIIKIYMRILNCDCRR